MAEQRTVFFVNNDGGGFADNVTVEAGTTISDLFAKKVGGTAANYKIRVNGQPVQGDYLLQMGDRVSCTPAKIQGAVSA
jgi:sulfur carrier protein ThiS